MSSPATYGKENVTFMRVLEGKRQRNPTYFLLFAAFGVMFLVLLGVMLYLIFGQGCYSSLQCSDQETNRVCNPESKQCVECLTEGDCSSNADTCGDKNTCMCGNNTKCTDATLPVCNEGTCVQCAQSSQCWVQEPHCNLQTFTCYGCDDSSMDPYQCAPGYDCDKTADSKTFNQCIPSPCSDDSECPPGKTCDAGTKTCMGQDLFYYKGDTTEANLATGNVEPDPSWLITSDSTISSPLDCSNKCANTGSACTSFTWIDEPQSCYLFSEGDDDKDKVDTATKANAWFGSRLSSSLLESCRQPGTGETSGLECGNINSDSLWNYPATKLSTGLDKKTIENSADMQSCIDACNFQCASNIPQYATMDTAGNCNCYAQNTNDDNTSITTADPGYTTLVNCYTPPEVKEEEESQK